jgi:steroid Delta-isomerase
MPKADKTQAITDAVHRYIELIANGSARDLAELYADDATVEDPVGGGEVHIGRQAIQGFYAQAESVEKESELVSLRVAGNEAAFHFRLIVTAGDNKLLIEPIDVMVFDGQGKVTSMKAYWSAADVRKL